MEIIKNDLLKLKEINRKIETTKEETIKGTIEEVVIEIDSFKERMLLIESIFEDGEQNLMENWKFDKKVELLNIYKELHLINRKKLIAYTDGSLIEDKIGFG